MDSSLLPTQSQDPPTMTTATETENATSPATPVLILFLYHFPLIKPRLFSPVLVCSHLELAITKKKSILALLSLSNHIIALLLRFLLLFIC